MVWMILLGLAIGYLVGLCVAAWRFQEIKSRACSEAYQRGRDDAISYLVV